jgi:hypothetical protein
MRRRASPLAPRSIGRGAWLGLSAVGRNRPWVLIGDGAYACVRFAQACQRQGVTRVARLRLDAALEDAPGPVPAGRRGRKPKKGQRQPSARGTREPAGGAGVDLDRSAMVRRAAANGSGY